MFLPENPSVSCARNFLSSSLRCFAYLLKMAARECTSGRLKGMLRSILLSMAGSKSSFLLVAQMSITLVVDSKLSILRSRVDRMRRLASCMSEDRLRASASISSMKMMTLPMFLQISHISARLRSLLPQNSLMMASMGMYTRGILTCCEMILALVVLPVPGGPSNRIALGRLGSFFILVIQVISSQMCGCSRVSRMVSSMALFWDSQPARESQSSQLDLVRGSNTVTPNYCSFLQFQFQLALGLLTFCVRPGLEASEVMLGAIQLSSLGFTAYRQLYFNASISLSVMKSAFSNISLKLGLQLVLMPVTVSRPF